LNKVESIRHRPDETPAALAPVQDYLAEPHARIAAVTGGKPADYIPELGKAEPDLFGIAIATVDAEVNFTIQSVSKPSMYGYALQRYGRAAVLNHVGVN
jgi:glutaminase